MSDKERRESRDRGISQIDQIMPKHGTAKWVAALVAGGILILVMISAAGVFDGAPPAAKVSPDAGARAEVAAAPAAPTPAAEPPDSGAEPAPPPAPRMEIGTLSIRSSPGVEVRDGAVSLGKTPLSIELPPGDKRLRLVNGARFIDLERTFKVRGGATELVSLSFPTGTLRLEGPAGAKVSVDGRAVGTLPVEPIEIVEGKHRLDVKYGGAKMQQQLTVVKDRELKYTVGYQQGEAPM